MNIANREIPSAWCIWFTGLVDGEGCFTYKTVSSPLRIIPRFHIILQDDDSLIREIHTTLGFGCISFTTPRTLQTNGKVFPPRATWCTSRKRDLELLCVLFRAHPLHSKKAAEFAIWETLVIQHSNNPTDTRTLAQTALRLINLNPRRSGRSGEGRARLESFLCLPSAKEE